MEAAAAVDPISREASTASAAPCTTASASSPHFQQAAGAITSNPQIVPSSIAATAASVDEGVHQGVDTAYERAEPSTPAAAAPATHTVTAAATAQGKRVVIWKGFWSSKDCRQHRDYLFVYGDNDQRKGVGGQAVIRNEPNAIGISTKKAPNSRATAYWTDTELASNTARFQADITMILRRLQQSSQYTTLVMPEKGFGTGLSKLPAKAPKTFQRLKSAVHRMLEDLQEGSSAHMKW